MSDHEIFRVTDLQSLRSLPLLSSSDRQVLERLLLLAPDVALSTAAAVLRSHQPDLHNLIFPRGRERAKPEIGQLAKALVYLGLAMAAPAQGKILPILSSGHLREAQSQVAPRFGLWQRATIVGVGENVEGEAIPDAELRIVLDVLIDGFRARSLRDPRWLRAVAYSEAGAFYAVLSAACREQFGGAVELEAVSRQLQRIARTRDLLNDALADDDAPKPFDAKRQAEYMSRLRRYGWEEHVATNGRNLTEVARDTASHGLRAATSFALTEEWRTNGASLPTNGHRYFVRPTLLPDSAGLARWAQEERLKPLQKMLAGNPRETGLRLKIPSVEVLLEYVGQRGHVDFLGGQWARTSNEFAGWSTRFGGFAGGGYQITLFPAGKLDPTVGVCPVIEVESEAG